MSEQEITTGYLNPTDNALHTSEVQNASAPSAPKSKNRKTIIIVLVGGAIFLCAIILIAIFLLTSSYLGVSSVQNSTRDVSRRDVLQQVNVAINEYYGKNGTFPAEDSIAADATTNKILIGSADNFVKLTGVTIPLPSTSRFSTATGSLYCYKLSGNSYSVGVNLENGSTWYTLGNGTINCDHNSVMKSSLKSDTSSDDTTDDSTTLDTDTVFTSADVWFNKKPYPAALTTLLKSNTYTVECSDIYIGTEGTYVNETTSAALTDSDTKDALTVLNNSTRTVYQIRKCDVSEDVPTYQKTFYLYNYCNENCGGGIGAMNGIMYYFQGDVEVEFNNTTGAYGRCMDVLAYTLDTELYLGCGAGDGGFSAAEIYKSNLYTSGNSTVSIAKETNEVDLP